MIKPQLPEAYLTNYTHPLGSTKTDSNKNIILSKRVRLGRGCHANDHVAVIGKDLSHMVRSVAVPNVRPASTASCSAVGPTWFSTRMGRSNVRQRKN